MDRGERRRRDEVYVTWMVKRYLAVTSWKLRDFPRGDRLVVRKLGLRKGNTWRCHHCSKKTPGRPKLPRGACGVGMDRSPKKGRNRWRQHLDEE